jgi:superfamily II DNA/RNA helicase
MATTLMIVSRQRAVAWMPSAVVSKSDLVLRRRSSTTIASAAITRWGSSSFGGSQGGHAARGASTSTTTARFYSSSTEDRSAMSQSRAPFKMPKNSPDDSKPKSTEDTISWTDLGIWPDVSHYLQNELNLHSPTTVQAMVIPKLLQQQQQYISGKDGDDDQQQQHLAFLAATGSGKTIAYVLPLLQQLKRQEQEVANPEEMLRRPQRPRVVILAPTRELVQQITTVVKSLSHCLKVSSHALMGGSSSTTASSTSGNKSLSRQTKTLQQRPMDVIVATPGRLLQHWKQKNSIFLGNVQTIVLDEMDTMLEQGFQKDLEQILAPLMMQGGGGNNEKSTTATRPKDGEDDWDSDSATRKASALSSSAASSKSTPPRIILTSATMTQSVQKLLGDSPKTSNLQLGAKRSYLNQKQKEEQQEQLLQQQEGTKKKAKASTPVFQFPHMTIVTAPGLHKAVPRLKQTFVDVGATDKMSLLIDVLSSNARGTRNEGAATIIFCNKVASVRAVQYALSEARIESLAYHAELNSAARTENLQLFRQAMEGRSGSSSTSKSSNNKKVVDEDEWGNFEDMDNDTLPPSSSSTTTKEPINVLVCTDLAARGLDMPNIDHVVMFDFPLNSLDYLHRCGRTARGKDGTGAVTALVSKRDKVLALAIERAVRRGEPLDGLSSRKSDYTPSASTTTGGGGSSGSSGGRGSGSGSSRPTGDYKKRITTGGPTAGGRTSNTNGNSKPQRGRAAASPSRSGGGGSSGATSRSGSPGRRSR